jgi:hypothetical protein
MCTGAVKLCHAISFAFDMQMPCVGLYHDTLNNKMNAGDVHGQS